MLSNFNFVIGEQNCAQLTKQTGAGYTGRCGHGGQDNAVLCKTELAGRNVICDTYRSGQNISHRLRYTSILKYTNKRRNNIK